MRNAPEEKVKRYCFRWKETMRVMGLGSAVHCCSCFIESEWSVGLNDFPFFELLNILLNRFLIFLIESIF